VVHSHLQGQDGWTIARQESVVARWWTAANGPAWHAPIAVDVGIARYAYVITHGTAWHVAIDDAPSAVADANGRHAPTTNARTTHGWYAITRHGHATANGNASAAKHDAAAHGYGNALTANGWLPSTKHDGPATDEHGYALIANDGQPDGNASVTEHDGRHASVEYDAAWYEHGYAIATNAWTT
jgi:hypothetical protein